MGSFWNRLKGFFTGTDGSGEDARAQGTGTAPVPASGTPATPASGAQTSSTPVGPASGARTSSPPARPAAATSATAAAPARPPAASAAPAPAKSEAQNPYVANEAILGLSPEEFRKRALKIVPWRTAWIGRVDTIPPQSDERTALIDKGLLLRGFLTREQLAEIHRVGDLWIKHHEADQLASALAAKTADAAIEQRREERRKRKEEKQRLAAEREKQRVEGVARRKREDIIFLGRGVSSGLADRRSNIEALQAAKLPVLSSPADVAKALGLTIPQLRWLCFHQEAAEKTHYHYFEVPKRSGGKRLLSAPQPTLKQAQAWILENILQPLPTEAPAHGFIKGRSTVSNAAAHLDRDVVVNLDLKDFFPTITFRRVKGVFQRLGYSPSVSTVLALLCTESPRRQVDYDGKRYWVAVAERGLPQGACTSPALSNQIARKLDRRLRGRMAKLGWEYTRYADDLTFSAPAGKRDQVPFLMAAVRHVAEEEGFALNPNKGRVQRVGGRQSVTGIVVNEKLSVPREEVRRLRAILHQARKTGLEAQNREGRANFEAWLHGKIAYVCMVDAAKGRKLLDEFEALRGGKRASAGS